MRTQSKNKQNMWYSHYAGVLPEYEKDSNGNIVYIEIDGQLEPVETGGVIKTYEPPQKFKATIGSKLNKLSATSYGVDQSNIYSTLVVPKNTINLIVGDIIWRNSEVKYNTDGTPDESSADYRVMGYMNEGLVDDYYLMQRLSVEEIINEKGN